MILESVTCTSYQNLSQHGLNECPIKLLPDEIILEIFKYFSEVKDFFSITLVSKRWNQLSMDDFLWKSWLAQDFPFIKPIGSAECHKEYKKQKKIRSNIKAGICEQNLFIMESTGRDTYPKFVGHDELVYIDTRIIKKIDLKTNKVIYEKTFNFLPRKIEEHRQLLFIIGLYQIEVLDAAAGTMLREFKVEPEMSIYDVTIQGDYLFASASLDDVFCWKITTGEIVSTWKCPGSIFPSVKSNAQFLVYGDRYGAVRLWNFDSQKWSEKYQVQKFAILHMHIDQDILYTVDFYKGVYSFNLNTKESKRLIKAFSCNALYVAEGLLFVGRDFYNSLEVWDLQTMKRLASYNVDPFLHHIDYKNGFLLTTTVNDIIHVRNFNPTKRPLKRRRKK